MVGPHFEVRTKLQLKVTVLVRCFRTVSSQEGVEVVHTGNVFERLQSVTVEFLTQLYVCVGVCERVCERVCVRECVSVCVCVCVSLQTCLNPLKERRFFRASPLERLP